MLLGMAARITVERQDTRPVWDVRVEGTRVGVVYRRGKEFRALQEGSSAPLPSEFSSREAAARALGRKGGHQVSGDEDVQEIKPRGGRRAD
jgi:hypothetical protein